MNSILLQGLPTFESGSSFCKSHLNIKIQVHYIGVTYHLKIKSPHDTANF